MELVKRYKFTIVWTALCSTVVAAGEVFRWFD